MKLKYLALFLVFIIFLISSCATQITTDTTPTKETQIEEKPTEKETTEDTTKNNGYPSWFDDIIEKGDFNSPESLTKCEYNDQTVYFIASGCCDFLDPLMDENGIQICAPSGGITGRGDGKCTDYFETRSNCELVWEKTERKYTATVLNEARDNDIEIEIISGTGSLIAIIRLESKKKFYDLVENQDISNPSFRDFRLNILAKEQDLIIKENNEGISETFHFDPEEGDTIIISYYPPGRIQNEGIQSEGKLVISQRDGPILLL